MGTKDSNRMSVDAEVSEVQPEPVAATTEDAPTAMCVEEVPAANTTAEDASGPRVKKAVERFEVAEIKKSAPIVVVQGKGTRLGDLADVKKRLDKYTGSSDEAKALHNIIWGKPGQAAKLKRSLNEFSGISPADEDSTLARAGKCSGSNLRVICKILGVHQGTIGAMAENVVAFLKNPSKKGGATQAKRKTPAKSADSAPKKRKTKSTPPAAKKPVSKKTQEKPPKEIKEPVKQSEDSEESDQEEERDPESSQKALFTSKVTEILEKAGEKFLELSYKKIRNMIEEDLSMKIDGDAKSSLKEITAELFQARVAQSETVAAQ